MTGVTLRMASSDDAEILGALHVTTWHETYRGIVPEEMLAGLSVGGQAAMWRSILAAPGDLGCIAVVLAEDCGTAVGFGSCGQQRDQSLIDAGFSSEFGAIYVLRSHQGHGVGRALMASMSRELTALGHTTASLWVLRENDPARAFYDKLGGVVVGERTSEQAGAALTEDAYGWRTLSDLSG